MRSSLTVENWTTQFIVQTYIQINRVWGKILDSESLAIIAQVYDLPSTNRGGMTFLDENIKFTMALDSA